MNGHPIQMNGHRNKKQIGQIATDFDEWSSKSEANWLKQSPPNGLLHSFLYSVKLRVILMNSHQNQRHIGQTISSKHFKHSLLYHFQWNCIPNFSFNDNSKNVIR